MKNVNTINIKYHVIYSFNSFANSLIKSITLELLNGEHCGMLLCDSNLHASENGRYNWRFNQLMRALNHREKLKNNAEFDVVNALMNKCVYVILNIYETENRYGKKLFFQNFEYISYPYSEEYTQRILTNYELVCKQRNDSIVF